jgi:hypothetical protein
LDTFEETVVIRVACLTRFLIGVMTEYLSSIWGHHISFDH